MINPGPFVYQARLETMMADINELRAACRDEGTPRIQNAIDNAERWFGVVTPETEEG